MAIVQCDEGHHYDKSLNRFCPHCPVNTQQASTGRSRAASEDDESGHTVAAGSDAATSSKKPASPKSPPGPSSRADTNTVAVWANNLGIDPVVGWLVAFDGSHQGRDYRINSGLNIIGRDPSSQICIRGDESISRENHASIFYNSRDTSFYISMEKGKAGVFVNDAPALSATLLKPYDVIEIGATKLVFVPLCGPQFRWNEKKPKGEKDDNGPRRTAKVQDRGDEQSDLP